MIRSILCVIFLIFVLILSLPQYAVLAIIRRKNRQKSAQIGQRFVVWAAKGLTFIAGTRVLSAVSRMSLQIHLYFMWAITAVFLIF